MILSSGNKIISAEEVNALIFLSSHTELLDTYGLHIGSIGSCRQGPSLRTRRHVARSILDSASSLKRQLLLLYFGNASFLSRATAKYTVFLRRNVAANEKLMSLLQKYLSQF